MAQINDKILLIRFRRFEKHTSQTTTSWLLTKSFTQIFEGFLEGMVAWVLQAAAVVSPLDPNLFEHATCRIFKDNHSY